MGLFSFLKGKPEVTAIAGNNEIIIVDFNNNVLAVYDCTMQSLKSKVPASDQERSEWTQMAKDLDWNNSHGNIR